MNILRWKRKSNKKVKPKTLLLFIFSLIMTTFAWIAYSKVIEPTLNIHMASWDMEYYIDSEKKTNPIEISIPMIYPTMEEDTVVVDIFNNGETQVDIDYHVKSLSIAGTTYEAVYEGTTPSTSNYITIAPSILTTVDTTDEDTGATISKQIYKSAVTNDITRFPFTIEIEHSAQIDAVSENEYGVKSPGEGYLKATVNWLGDNDRLDSEWGYKVGEFLTANPTSAALSVVLSIDSYQVDPEGSTFEVTMPSTGLTRPYLPEGYSRVVGTSLTTGLVVEDTKGNQYVWVEVPKSKAVYTTAGIEITDFTDDEYNAIEADLKKYVGDYTTREDQYYDQKIGISDINYDILKKSMLKSIYTYGGFYIGRYETGVDIADGPRTKATITTPSTTPVIKANSYLYNFVTCSQANTIAGRLTQGDYQTSLMFGLQWDLLLKYLDTKGATQNWVTSDSTLNTSKDFLTTNSSSWGNYINNSYSLINANAQYYLSSSGWHNTIPYVKEEENDLLLTTGANSGFCNQNIYDLAGNISEWTYNVTSSAQDATVIVGGNGGDYLSNGANTPVAFCGSYDITVGVRNVGFRVALFSKASADSAWGSEGLDDNVPGGDSFSGGDNGPIYVAPSEIFDSTGTNADKLHIGDFVNYDAGTWTAEEIAEIQTGEVGSLVTANGSTSLPSTAYQFGGFTAGSSRNGNATPYDASYNYVKDAETSEALTGWRVFDIEDDGTVVLISAGNPEDYYHPYVSGQSYAYVSEYILTGNVNSSWTSGETEKANYQKRNWSKYVNTAQKAKSATVLTKSNLDNWYSRYMGAENANISTNETFQQIYSEPYLNYQNIIDNYSHYWISNTNYSEYMYGFKPNNRYVSFNGGMAFGVRVLVSISSDVKFTATPTGTKTVTGGNMDTYGGDQTYNCWEIQ